MQKSQLPAISSGKSTFQKNFKKIKRRKTNMANKSKKIIVVETGYVCDSIVAASEKYNVSIPSIHKSLNKGVRVKGKHFKYYSEYLASRPEEDQAEDLWQEVMQYLADITERDPKSKYTGNRIWALKVLCERAERYDLEDWESYDNL